ncbi:hypothetical protein [Pyruvatibacter mobilis]|uniref:hypothetical protein n=1 Tax=Pyruvatibacter mobilis TaxID=1712261 RepID=UPI003C79F738
MTKKPTRSVRALAVLADGTMRIGVCAPHADAYGACRSTGMWLTGLTGPAVMCSRDMGTTGAR